MKNKISKEAIKKGIINAFVIIFVVILTIKVTTKVVDKKLVNDIQVGMVEPYLNRYYDDYNLLKFKEIDKCVLEEHCVFFCVFTKKDYARSCKSYYYEVRVGYKNNYENILINVYKFNDSKSDEFYLVEGRYIKEVEEPFYSKVRKSKN